jgi:hypothetical protein
MIRRLFDKLVRANEPSEKVLLAVVAELAERSLKLEDRLDQLAAAVESLKSKSHVH